MSTFHEDHLSIGQSFGVAAVGFDDGEAVGVGVEKVGGVDGSGVGFLVGLALGLQRQTVSSFRPSHLK
jgi:hypothetical protein